MTRHTFGRALATATAALTTIAVAAPGATAANLGPAQFSGAAKAQALQLSLNAPADLVGLLGQQNTLELGISATEVTTSTANDLFAKTQLLSGLLSQGAASDADGDSFTESILAQEIGPISLGVGSMSYNLDRATRTVTSTSELAHVRVALDTVLKATPAGGAVGQVSDVVTEVVNEVDGLTGGIVGEINGIVNEIEDTLEDAAGLTIDIPDVSVQDVNVLPSILETEVLDIRKLWSETSVGPVADKVRSSATSGIVGASILGGVVEIPAWTFSAWAETAGTPGSANWGGNTEALALNVLGNQVLSLDGGVLTVAGQELDLNDPALAGIIGDPAGLVSQLDALVGDLLDLTGLSITNGRLTGEAAPDGSMATATASAFSLSLAPLNAARAVPELEGLVSTLGLGSADQALRLQIDLLPATATATAAPAPAPTPEVPQLPRTGGGAAAMALGLVAMGGAAGLRRKF